MTSADIDFGPVKSAEYTITAAEPPQEWRGYRLNGATIASVHLRLKQDNGELGIRAVCGRGPKPGKTRWVKPDTFVRPEMLCQRCAKLVAPQLGAAFTRTNSFEVPRPDPGSLAWGPPRVDR